MITSRQRNFLIFFVSKALFLGIGYSLILSVGSHNSWLCCILGTLLGIIFCFMIRKILDYKQKKNLTDLLKELSFLGIILRFILILFAIFMIQELLFIIQLFAKSFFLINSNTFLIILPIILLCTYTAFKGYKLIAYVSECLFPIAIFLALFAFLALIFKVDFSNLKPIFTISNTKLLQGTFYFFCLSTCPLLFILDLEIEDNDISKSYIPVSIVLIIISILIIGVMGQFLITIYRFPEYMVLKNISLFNFIEKVENIISISWILDNFVAVCLYSCFLKRMLPKKYNNYSFLIIIFIIFIIVCTVFGINYIVNLNFYFYLPHILAILSIPIILTIYIHTIRRKQNMK